MNGNPVTPAAVVPGPAPAPAGGAKSAPGTEGAAAESRGCWWNRDWLLGLLLVIATLLAYQPAWRGQRLWDDDAHLTPPALRSLEGLARIWTQIGATQQYYPLTFTAFWVQHKLWGDATLGYHLVNILLHSLSALLFLAILRQLKIPGAWLAAACFALHPVHVESVAWMTQLKNTLSGVLCLGSLAAYLGFDQTRKKRLYALALGLFALGLLGKTAIAPLPAGMLVILWWKRRRLSWRQDALPLAPFFLAGLAAGLITVWLEQNLYGARGAEFEFSFQERCLIAGRAIWFHLANCFGPPICCSCIPAGRSARPSGGNTCIRRRPWRSSPGCGGCGTGAAPRWRRCSASSPPSSPHWVSSAPAPSNIPL